MEIVEKVITPRLQWAQPDNSLAISGHDLLYTQTHALELHGWCDLPITAQIESFAERSLVSVRSGGVLSVAVNSFHAMTALQSRRGRLIHLTLVS